MVQAAVGSGKAFGFPMLWADRVSRRPRQHRRRAAATARIAGPARARAPARGPSAPVRLWVSSSAAATRSLAITGLAQGATLAPAVLARPHLAAELAFAWFGAACVGALASAAFARLAGERRLIGGGACFGGCRNVSPVWAGVAGHAPPEGELALQIAVAWTFLVSALVCASRAVCARWFPVLRADSERRSKLSPPRTTPAQSGPS